MPRTGDGLRLRANEADDMANDGTVGILEEFDLDRDIPTEDWGDRTPPSEEYRRCPFRSYSNDDVADPMPSVLSSSEPSGGG